MQKKFSFIACLCIYINCIAQQYPFVQYTPKDGLVNSRVRKIYQDSKGRMYFITFGGLSVYDGTRFTNYTRQEGLPNDLINDVLEINDDTILIATNSGSINTLVHGKIGQYPLTGDPHPLINSFLKSNDGNIYATGDYGLYMLRGNQLVRLPVYNKQQKDIGRYLDKILEWNNYLFVLPWSEGPEKLIVYDKIRKTTLEVYALPSVLSIEKDGNNNIWITTTTTGTKLLNVDSLKAGKIRLYDPPPQFSGISGKTNYFIFFDRANNMWAYNGRNIHIISANGSEQIISTEHGIKTSSLHNLFEDREGIIWIGTDGSGVIKMRGNNIEFLNNLPPGDLLMASAVQHDNDTVWLHNNASGSVLRVYKNEIKNFPLPFKKSFGTIYIQGSRLYLANDQQIVCIDNKAEQSSFDHPHLDIIRKGKEERFGYGLVDPYGAIILHAAKADTAFAINVYYNHQLVTSYKLGALADKLIIDKRHRLWVPTRDDHLLVFFLHPDNPTRYLQLVKDFKNELPKPGIRSIATDTAGNLWIGTRYNGLYRIELAGEKIVSLKQFTTHEGMTDNFIYSLACDNNNTIWAGTQSGLDKIFLKDGQYIISNVSKSNNFFQTIHQISVTTNNTVWALTGDGSVLKAEQTSPVIKAPPPSLLLILQEVNSSPFDDSTTHFSHRQNNFVFSAAAPSFFDEKSIRYSYQLQGSGNSTWSTPSNNPYFNFSNLSPGSYTLQVKALFPEAMYPPQTTTYAFTILPPWWQTVLFRLIAACAVMGILIIGTRFYYRRKLRQQRVILEKQQAIEKERTRIATDMHDDLGAGLSRIKFLSETIGLKKQQQIPIEEDISKIREYSHEMIDKMGEIVWALNEKNDTLSDLLSYTRAYAVEYLSQNGVSCNIESPDVLPTDFVTGEFRRNIFLTVKEALHNVIKHSQASTVFITITVDRSLTIEIKDNGSGFDRKTIRPFSNGIANMEKRINGIGGKFEIAGIGGTMIKIGVPL